jgi:ABC-type proline/glycine betaine transport system substrate-binding protein
MKMRRRKRGERIAYLSWSPHWMEVIEQLHPPVSIG